MAVEGSAMAAEGWGLHVQVRVPLDAIELDVDWRPESDHVAILGPSGSGKSTLLRALAGLEPGAQGRVTFGDDVWLDSDSGVYTPAWERRVGWVPQDALLFLTSHSEKISPTPVPASPTSREWPHPCFSQIYWIGVRGSSPEANARGWR